MCPPIIGVSSNFGLDMDADPPRERSYLLAAYTDAVFAGGGTPHPFPIPPKYDDALLDTLLAGFDGLMFTGGFDLHPRHFGEPVHPKTHPLHERRDQFEMDLYRRAEAGGIPILAICLGFQTAHVARGGRLIQHIDDLDLSPKITHYLPGDRNAFHAVRIEPGSRVAEVVGATEIEVSSRHHQIVDARRQGPGLRPVAWAPDGVLEASEDCDGRFLLAVQWHPEDLTDRPEHLRLFAALVEAADAWRSSHPNPEREGRPTRAATGRERQM